MLSGCGSSVTLSEKEDAMIAEYLSKVVLEKDKRYDQELQDYDYYENAIKASKEKEENNVQQLVGTSNNSDGNLSIAQTESQTESQVETQPTEHKSTVSLNEGYGKKSFKVSYQAAKYYESYPSREGNPYFVIEKQDGYELCVVTFKINNTTKKDSKFNLISSNVKYSLTIGETTYRPLLTLLENDMQFFNQSVKAQSSKQGGVVFRIPAHEKGSKATLEVSCGSKTAVETIK